METDLINKIIQRTNMEEIDIVICLKKKNKDLKNIKKIIVKLIKVKSLHLVY